MEKIKERTEEDNAEGEDDDEEDDTDSDEESDEEGECKYDKICNMNLASKHFIFRARVVEKKPIHEFKNPRGHGKVFSI